MDVEVVRWATEWSRDDDYYLWDLDEEFHAVSSEDDDSVNQTSWIEHVCKKARTSAGTLYTDGNWYAEDKKMCNNNWEWLWIECHCWQ